MKLTQALSRWRSPVTGLGLGLTIFFFFVFTILSSGVTGAPADSSEGLVLNYELGKTYTYNYETNSVIKVIGTSNEESHVQLKGQAFLTPTKKNDFVLTLGDFTLDVTSPNEKVAAPIGALKGSSSRFTTERGVIKDFYVNGEESAWVANYHRAIVSIFNNYALQDSQHSKAFYLENDVSGTNCPTEYEITSDGTFTKRRDLNKCRNRDGGYSEQYGVPYSPIENGEPTSDTSIRSTQECVQKFVQGVLNTGECTEVHKVTLLSSGKDAGGNAKVTAKIQFKSIGPGRAPVSTPSKPSTILFDHDGTDLKRPGDEAATELIEGLAGKLCLSTGLNGRFSGKTAPVFLTLKAKMRFVSTKVLENIYEKLKAGRVCEANDDHLKTLEKLYVDAAAMAGSTDSIAFVAKLVKSGAVSKNSQKRFRLFTAFANRPGESALESMTTLLSTGTDLSPKYLLTASGIAYQYCLSEKQACESSKAYIALVNEIAKQTKENCGASGSGDQKKLKAAVTGLQALGNLDTLTAAAIATISSCLEKSDRLKIHALQSIRRDPCQESIKATARQILTNRKNPSHLRISAYLTISQCYTKVDSDAIRAFIKTEESIQVLSFIKSHRDNAGVISRAEANLDAGLFEGVDLEKLGKDPRKFASALAYSNELETYSANIIYSEDSFLPKIVYANSSTKLYGQDFGLIEFGAHLGGLEQDIMERMFGPKGENPTAFQENTRRRPKREGPAPTINPNEIEVFHSQVKPVERKTEPSDVYIRVFGTTVYTHSLTFEKFLSSAKNPADPYFADLLDKALKGEEVDLTESYPLYGDELIIPTVSGLSLWIHNEGAAILSLKYSHSLSEDFVTFKPKFRPGVSIANNMKMSIAGDIIEAGLRAETRIAASTDIALTGTLTASEDHYGYDIRVSMPPTDVQLVDISNELFWILQTRHTDYDLKQKMKTLNPYVFDTGKKCAKYLPIITGIKACFQFQLPAFSGRTIPSFPLSGPAFGTFELSPPTGAKELVFKFKVSKPDSGLKEKILSVEVDAPGSAPSIKSLIKSTVVYGSEGVEKFSFELDSPAKKAGFSGEKTMGTPGVHDFSYTVHVDGYDYKLFFKRRYNTDNAGIKSSSYDVRYKLPNQPEITIWSLDLKGTLEGVPKFQHSLNFKLNDVNSIVVKEFISFSASLEGEWGDEVGKKLTSTAKFSCHGKQVFSTNKVFTRAVGSLLYESDTKFVWRGEEKDATVKGNMALAGPKEQRTGFSFQGTITSASSPKINSDFDLSCTKTADHREIGFNLKQKGSEGGLIKAVHTWDDVNGAMKIKYDGKAIYPPLDINYEKSYEIENTPEKASLTFQYSCKNEKVADIRLFYNKPASTYEVNLMGSFTGKKFTLGSKNSIAGGHHIFEHNVGVQPGFKASAKTDLFESRDVEGVWKNRVTTISSDAFPQTYVYELKYDVDGQIPSHTPKLFKNGEGTISISVSRDSIPMATLIITNKKASEDQHIFRISSIVEKVYSTNFEVKCSTKEERVEIITSVQSPPREDGRVLKLVLSGKDAGDKPGERTFGFSVDLKPNGIADPQQAILISNSNRWKNVAGTFNLESDNNIQLFGKNRNTKVRLGGTTQGNAKLSVGFDHTDPEGKNSKLEASIETQDAADTKFIKVKHELVSTGAKTSGNFQLVFEKFNPLDNTGDLVTSYEHNGQKEYEVKLVNSKVGNMRTSILTVDGFGKVFRSPIQYELRVEGGSRKARVKFLGGYNDPNSAPAYFNLQIENTAGTSLQKHIIDAAFDPSYNQEKGAAFSGKVTFAYGYKSAGDFEIEATGLIETAGVDGKQVYSFNRVIKARPGLFKLEFGSESKNPGNPPVLAEAKINVENSADSLSVTVALQHPLILTISGSGQTRLAVDLQTTKDINNILFICQAKIPSTKFETLSVKFQRKVSPDGSSRVSSLSGKLDEKKIDLVTNIVLTETKKTADLTLKLNNDAPKKLSLKYDLAGEAQSAEATYQWGSDVQVIKSKGSITNAPNNGFTAKFEFDIPSIEQQWNLEVNRVETEPKKSFSFVATSAKTKQNLKLQYAKEGNDKTGFTWSAEIDVDMAAPYDKYDIDGSFKAVLDKKSYVQSQSIPGSSITLSANYIVGEDKRYRSLTLDAGNSLLEKRVNGKLCLSKANCFDLATLLKDERLDKSFRLTLTGAEYSASVSSSYKISEDSQTRLTSFEYSFTDPSKVKKELGIKFYKKPGAVDDLELTKADISAAPSKVYTKGFEMSVPERTYAAQVACGEWNNVDTEAGEVSLWFDKKNSPDQKLVLGFSKTRASVQEEGQGKDIILTIRHHKLQRDLKVKTKYRYGITSKVFDLTTEIDIFKSPDAKVVFTAEFTHDVPTETYGLKYGVKSDGQGFSVITNCEGMQMDFPPFFTATCTYSRKAPNAKDINYKVVIKTDENQEFLQIQEGGADILYCKSAFGSGELADPVDPTRTSSASGATTELRLPGMTDTRIINFRWSKSPLRFSITTNPSSSKDVTGFWIGATSVQGGGFGISRTDENGRTQELAHFAAAVRSKQLQIDFDWNRAHIASYFEYVGKRGQEVEQLATKTCANLNTQLWQSKKAIRKSLMDAAQDFEPLLQWYESQLNQIGKKYNFKPLSLPRGQSVFEESEVPPKSALVAAISGVNKCMSSCAASINAFLDSLSKRETLPTPDAVKERSLKFRQFAETVANKIRGFVAATKELKEKYPFLKKNARKFREKLVDKLQSVYEQTRDDLNDLFPYPEVNHFLEHFNDYFEVALLEPEKISQENKTEILGDLEKAVNKILSNSYSINFLQGKISAKLPLLGKLDAFRKNQAPFKDFTNKESECIKELFDDPSSIMPPVNATAFIVGNNNYVTFDGTVGSFEKTCQFLLTSDFVNKNLSVVFDLGDRASDERVGSTLFVTDHKTTIGITRGVPNHQVVANGKFINVGSEPSRVGAFVIYEEASYVLIEGDMGITLGCTSAFNLCAVQVSGFYHGKLQGLFGKFNNEPSDDWTLPNGQVTTSDGIFQKSWKLDQKCTGKPIRKSEQLSLLYKALKRTNLDYDTFFSRSTTSPHRSLWKTWGVFASAPSTSPISFFTLLATSFFTFLLTKFFS